MKSAEMMTKAKKAASHPVRGAWIEIEAARLPVKWFGGSHPVRGAWIEILTISILLLIKYVAPRQGCVD